MTFDERVTALAPLSWHAAADPLSGDGPRCTAAIACAGSFAFAGVRYGKNVRDFLETLVHRQLAHRLSASAPGGIVHHLHANWRSIGRSRSATIATAARWVRRLIARKLMLLGRGCADCAGRGGALRDRRGQGRPVYPASGDPSAIYRSVRLCFHGPARPVDDAYLRAQTADSPRARSRRRPLRVSRDRRPRLTAWRSFFRTTCDRSAPCLAWCVVAVCPRGPNGLPACRAVFDRFAATGFSDGAGQRVWCDVRWFLSPRARQLVESGDLRSLSVADLNRFRDVRPRFASAQMEAPVGAWLAHGGARVRPGNGRAQEMRAPATQLVLRNCPRPTASSDRWRACVDGASSLRTGGPVAGPAGGPDVRVSERKRAPEAPPQSPWEAMTLVPSTVLGDAALFAASGVGSRSEVRGSDPSLAGP